jgi:hypothetical protein
MAGEKRSVEHTCYISDNIPLYVRFHFVLAISKLIHPPILIYFIVLLLKVTLNCQDGKRDFFPVTLSDSKGM